MPHYNHKKKYICSGSRAFKSQRVGCQTITISIQKIILIHKFILKVQQILGSHKLKSYVYFWPQPSKIIESTLSFPEFVTVWKKWLYSICSFLSPATRLATPIFDHAHPKKFWAAFNVSTCKKLVYSISTFFRYSQFYIPITRLAMPIFDHAQH